MHIPDGYLSPQTAITLGAAMLPVWRVAAKKARQALWERQVPLLSLGAAFSFLVMMYNVPVPDGTTAHAVGGTILAIVLGPWGATIALTVSLALQALFFGDGGIWALGANAFNIAFVLPFVGYGVYRILAPASASPRRRALAAGLAGFVAMNAAALVTGVEFGLQPLLFHSADGTPLYSPYPLQLAIPAMAFAHLLVAGPVEGLMTGLVISYLVRVSPELLLERTGKSAGQQDKGGRHRKLWWGLVFLALLSPLGLLAQGDAWGEWSQEDMLGRLGFIPKGMAQLTGSWQSVLPDYTVPGLGNNLAGAALGYILSAFTGILLLALAVFLLARLAKKKNRPYDDHEDPPGGTPGGNGTEPDASTPFWLLETDYPEPPPPGEEGRQRTSFVEKTLADLTRVVQEEFLADAYAAKPGFLQGLDPRVKIIAFSGLIGLAGLVRHAETLVLLYTGLIILALASRIPLRAFVPRVWLVVPFFTGIMVLPSIFNLVRPGEPLFILWSLGAGQHIGPWNLPAEVTITRQGVAGAVLLVTRVGVSVSAAVLLTLTTRWALLLRALKSLFLPQAFVSTLEMTHRYLYLLLQVSLDRFEARKSRTVGRLDGGEGRGFMGRSMGFLLGKSLALGEEVYAAMIARGYRGETKRQHNLHWRQADFLWLAACGILVLAAWKGDIFLGR